MEHLTPDQRRQLADLLFHLCQTPDEVADTNDIAEMFTAYMKKHDYAYCHTDYDRIFQAVDEVCLHKPTRYRCSEAVENWIHYESPQHREEICAGPDNSAFPNEWDYLQGKA